MAGYNTSSDSLKGSGKGGLIDDFKKQQLIEQQAQRITELEAALHTSLEWTNELVAGRDARIKILEDAWHDLEAISLEYYHSLGIDKKENDRANEILDRLAHYKRILEVGK